MTAIAASMAASGCSAEQVAAAVAAFEVEQDRKREMTLAAERAKKDERRAAAAERQARKRDREALIRENNHALSRVTACDSALLSVTERDQAPVGAQAGADAFISSSEVVPPSPPKGGSAPRKTGVSARGCRLPDDFVPDETTIATGITVGHTRQHVFADGLDEFRDYWRGVPGAKGCKTDWQGTYRNRLRQTAPRGPRPRAGPASGDGLAEARQALRERMNGRVDRAGTEECASDPDTGTGAPDRNLAKQARPGWADERWKGPQLNLVAQRA